jgi:tripartite-type tricarboxylate transporter receptor subunit TctC
MTGFIPMAISVNPSTPYKTLGDLVQAGQANPNTINVALPNTTARIVFELLQQQTSTRFFGVPYNSTPSAMNDLIGGQVAATIDTTTATRPMAESGRIRPVAVTSAKATELLPGVPSVEEQGVRDFQVTAWNALSAQKDVPRAIVEKLRLAVARILAEPAFRQRMMLAGFEVPSAQVASRPPDGFIRGERERWGVLIRSAGIKAN